MRVTFFRKRCKVLTFFNTFCAESLQIVLEFSPSNTIHQINPPSNTTNVCQMRNLQKVRVLENRKFKIMELGRVENIELGIEDFFPCYVRTKVKIMFGKF